jgi:hypothetical protein
MERFNVKKFNKVESKENYRIEVSNGFEALEDMDGEVEINSAWEKRECQNFSQRKSTHYY